MAGIVAFEADLLHKRVFAMWAADGYQYRANILLEEGADIPMHVHNYAHDYELGVGTYGLTVEAPDGTVEPERTLEGGSKGHVPAYWRHHFRLLKWGGAPGKVTCYWAE